MSNLPIRTFICAAILVLLLFNLCLPTSIGVLTTTPFFTTTTSSSSASSTMASSSPSKDLHVTLAQKSKSPPTITLRVKNIHPSTPLTFLTWNTPLDPAILPLGILAVSLPDSADRLNKDSIKISRKTPPAADQFVTLAPGEAREQHVELKRPIVPLDKVEGGKVVVRCGGRWGDVWEEEVGPEEWSARAGKGGSGEWECEALEVEL